MRGDDASLRQSFQLRDLEKRVPADHPLRVIRGIVNAALTALSAEFDELYSPNGRDLDPAGAAAAGVAAAGVLFDPFGAAIGGADRLQPAVPLVRRARHRRRGVGRHHLHQEPRPAAGGRDRREVPRRGAGAAEGQGAAVDRAFLGRRHADGGLGQHEELPAERRLGHAARPRAQRRAGLPRRAAHATRRTPRPPIPRPGSIARGGARRRGCASWAMR